jgi:hypothetical protein
MNPHTTDDFPRSRRFVFVQLLFSLTIAEVARQVADLRAQGHGLLGVLPAYTHLMLATTVVATSWMGWSVSESSRRIKAKQVFSLAFVALLLDLVLVICYFILVRGAEVPLVGANPQFSAHNEACWISLILWLYFLWDFLTKAAPSRFGRFDSVRAVWNRCWERKFVERTVISLVVALYGSVLCYFLKDLKAFWSVALADFALCCLVLGFRAWKEKLKNAVGVAFAILALALAIASSLAE